jgi:beta-galactosidase
MYLPYAAAERYANDASKTKPLIQCEYAHAMGNSEGGFKEYWDLFRRYPKLQGGFIWDFVDQSIHWKTADGVQVYGYGGDFNRYDASDYNFLDNGLISPDRKPNPHMYEVAYFYQSIWVTESDLRRGEVNVMNENRFRDLSAYYAEWEITANGRPVRKGLVPTLNVGPQQTAKLTLDYAAASLPQNAELLLNICFKLKQAETLLPAGHIVARNQLTIYPYIARFVLDTRPTCEQCPIDVPAVKDNDVNYLIVRNDKFEIEFSRLTGFLSRYAVDGNELLARGSALTPNFWRAPTDNDFGANLQIAYRAWHNPEIKLVSLSHRSIDNTVVVHAEYEMPDVSGKLFLMYRMNHAGAVEVTQRFAATPGALVSNLFRFGMQMQMPACYEQVNYYGRGPVENYIDRHHAAFVGLYRQTVAEQFYPYIRPQENGAKTDLRWWQLVNATGDGLQFTGSAPFSASALHYTIESLDEGLAKIQRHSPEIAPINATQLCIDKMQMGVGCVNSWGALPLEQYMIPYADHTFSFIMQPVQSQY